MVKKAIALALLLASISCNDIFITGGNGTGGSSAGGTVFPSPTPIPSPTDPTTPITGTRTPDPIGGAILPLPQYAATLTKQVSDASPNLVATSCVAAYGQVGWGYLQAMVNALRARDTRWGFHCKLGNCGNISVDTIMYHATAGPEIQGTQGGWVVDLIFSECQNPQYTFINHGYDQNAGWSLNH